MQDLNTSRINWGIPSSWKLNTGEGTVLSKEINSISTLKVNSYIHVTHMHIKKWAPFMNTNWLTSINRAEGQFLYPCDEYAHQKVGSVYEHDLDELYEEGVRRFGNYPRNDGICAHCPSGCHSDNYYILRFPERQLQWLA